MFDLDYLHSLAMELDSLKNRVRTLIKDEHWLTDGEWKESVIRAFLRRHLPKTVEVGRGFVVTASKPSTQIDVLIYESSKPVLFQDGELVFLSPDAVLGIIEVKTSMNNSSFKAAIRKLCDNAQLVRSNTYGRALVGLFSFEDRTTDLDQIMATVREEAVAVDKTSNRVVNWICLGKSKFIRFWHLDPTNKRRLADKWHAYRLRKQSAPGYFIHNVIEGICPQSIEQNQDIWYPIEGKESSKITEIKLRDI